VQQTGVDPAKPPPQQATTPPTTATGTTPGVGARGAVRGAVVGEVVGGDAKTGAAAARGQSCRANEHKHAAAAILDKQTFYLDVEDTCRGIKHLDMVPNLSPQNLVSVEIGKDLMLNHGYIKNDFDVRKLAAPEVLERAAKELLEERWQKVTSAKLPAASVLQASTRRLG